MMLFFLQTLQASKFLPKYIGSITLSQLPKSYRIKYAEQVQQTTDYRQQMLIASKANYE